MLKFTKKPAIENVEEQVLQEVTDEQLTQVTGGSLLGGTLDTVTGTTSGLLGGTLDAATGTTSGLLGTTSGLLGSVTPAVDGLTQGAGARVNVAGIVGVKVNL
jgi:hypothetical protein